MDALGRDELDPLQKVKSRRGSRNAIGGLCVGAAPKQPKRMPSWMKKLKGRFFTDDNGSWHIYKVEYKCDDDYKEGGWVAWYKPKDAKRATDQEKHFSPLSWLGGKAKIGIATGDFHVEWDVDEQE